jgi:hypothetical protein
MFSSDTVVMVDRIGARLVTTVGRLLETDCREMTSIIVDRGRLLDTKDQDPEF